MAISKSFFSLRRGSTKSHTYSVLEGMQITKDRVTNVSNPRTSNQAKQRMKMNAVTNFYRALITVLNHSFEGVAYGKKSYEYFMKMALSSPKAIGAVHKFQKDFVPLNLNISVGSLQPLQYSFKSNVPSLTLPNPIDVLSIDNRTEFVSGILSSFGLLSGQLTFIIVQKGVPSFKRIILDTADTITDDFSWISSHFTVSNNGLSLKSIDEVDAFGAVLSIQVNNVWKRSTQELKLSESCEQSVYSYDSVSSAMQSYMNKNSFTGSVDYLNEGGSNRLASILGITADTGKLVFGSNFNYTGSSVLNIEVDENFNASLLEVAGDVDVEVVYGRVTLNYETSAPIVSNIIYNGIKLLSVTNLGKVLQSVTLAGNEVIQSSVVTEIGSLVINHVAGYNVEVFEKDEKWTPVSTTDVSKTYNALSDSEFHIFINNVKVFSFSILIENPTLPSMKWVSMQNAFAPYNQYNIVNGRKYLQLDNLPDDPSNININVGNNENFDLNIEDSMGNVIEGLWLSQYQSKQFRMPSEINYPYWMKLGNALVLYVTGV